MVQAVWPRSSQLLGLGVCGQSVAVGPGSSQWFRVCGRGVVSGSGCVSGI